MFSVLIPDVSRADVFSPLLSPGLMFFLDSSRATGPDVFSPLIPLEPRVLMFSVP